MIEVITEETIDKKPVTRVKKCPTEWVLALTLNDLNPEERVKKVVVV